jgi:hypothetical protein
MRRGWGSFTIGVVRFLVEFDHDASGTVRGTVTPEGRESSPFHGWLDLLRRLEGRTEETTLNGEEPTR